MECVSQSAHCWEGACRPTASFIPHKGLCGEYHLHFGNEVLRGKSPPELHCGDVAALGLSQCWDSARGLCAALHAGLPPLPGPSVEQCLPVGWRTPASPHVVKLTESVKKPALKNALKMSFFNLARVAKLVECHPVHWKVADSTPIQGTYLGCRFVQKATGQCFSLSLHLPLPSSP